MKYFTVPITGDKIPAVGFGSGTKWQVRKRGRDKVERKLVDEELVDVIKTALVSGFLHLDTAEFYTTREEIGLGIKESGIPRENIWLTDKYDPGWIDGDIVYVGNQKGPYDSLINGLKEMKLDYVDLFLIHSPFFGESTSGKITVEEAWRQMEKLQKEGYAKNIGVSNFNVEMMEKISKICEVPPQVNQIEFHCYLQDQSPGIVKFCKEKDILVEAYSPLTPILPHKMVKASAKPPLDPIIGELCKKYDVTETQLILNWVYSIGILPITTSSNPKRMAEILKITDFEVSPEDIEKITEVGKTFHFRNGLHEIFE